MHNHELLTRQREALIAFREAEQERQRVESQLQHDFDLLQQKVNQPREEAQVAQWRAKNSLEEVKLAHLSQTKTISFTPNDTPQDHAEAFVQAVDKVLQAEADIKNDVQTLQHLRDAQKATKAITRHAEKIRQNVEKVTQARQAVEEAWQRVQTIKRWEATAYYREQIEKWKEQAIQSDEEAQKHTEMAIEAVDRIQKALTIGGSWAGTAQIAQVGQEATKLVVQHTANKARAAQEIADQVDQLTEKALNVAQLAAQERRKRILTIIVTLVVIAIIAAAIYYSLFYGAGAEAFISTLLT